MQGATPFISPTYFLFRFQQLPLLKGYFHMDYFKEYVIAKEIHAEMQKAI